MILTLLLNLFYTLLLDLLNVLPVGSLPFQIGDAVNYFWYALNSFSFIFPVAALLQCLVLVLVFDAGMMQWRCF